MGGTNYIRLLHKTKKKTNFFNKIFILFYGAYLLTPAKLINKLLPNIPLWYLHYEYFH